MDFKLYEQGDGGELNLLGGDIESDKTLSNAIYLSLFKTDTWYDIFEDSDDSNNNNTSIDNDNNNLLSFFNLNNFTISIFNDFFRILKSI